MRKVLCALLCLVILTGCGKTNDETAETSCRVVNLYNYEKPAVKDTAVEESFFDDALFAGDSRMGALDLYGSFGNAEIAYSTSVNLLRLDSMPVDGREDETLWSVLESTEKGSVYLLLGINEIRTENKEPYLEAYEEVVTMLKENNPDVDVYMILEYMPREIVGLETEEMKVKVAEMNEGLKDIASRNLCFMLDLDTVLAGEDGLLKTEYSSDGLHLNSDGAAVVKEYIMTHVVREETYVKEVCE